MLFSSQHLGTLLSSIILQLQTLAYLLRLTNSATDWMCSCKGQTSSRQDRVCFLGNVGRARANDTLHTHAILYVTPEKICILMPLVSLCVCRLVGSSGASTLLLPPIVSGREIFRPPRDEATHVPSKRILSTMFPEVGRRHLHVDCRASVASSSNVTRSPSDRYVKKNIFPYKSMKRKREHSSHRESCAFSNIVKSIGLVQQLSAKRMAQLRAIKT